MRHVIGSQIISLGLCQELCHGETDLEINCVQVRVEGDSENEQHRPREQAQYKVRRLIQNPGGTNRSGRREGNPNGTSNDRGTRREYCYGIWG